MALKDLLVYLDQTERASIRLRLAIDLAQRHASRLTALYISEWSEAEMALERRKTAELARCSFDDMQRLEAGLEGQSASIEQHLQAQRTGVTARSGLEVDWRVVEGEPAIVLPQHSRYADLCIIGEELPNQSRSIGYSFAEEMLFVTGRPILLIPATGAFTTLGRHILIAWNSSRAAARSLNDALPLIERAEQVTVLSVNPTDVIDTYGALPAEHLLEHLKRHGATATAISAENVAPEAIAELIQAQALALGADLLVAGAYGQPRLREKLLGGVTRDLLASVKLPLMMAH